MRTLAPAAVLLAALVCTQFVTAQSVQIVYADGRHRDATAPQQDAKGRWSVECEGRRTVLHGGEVVAIVDAKGKETVIIPPLAPTPDTAETTAMLASLGDPKNKEWELSAEQLGQRPTRSVFDALVALGTDGRKDLRLRAITALARLHTKESAVAAANAVLAEKDPGTRRVAASVLFSVGEILKRSDADAILAKGIADKDAEIRIPFAILSKPDDLAANAVLRNDGLKHSDHHVREMAAEELGERGDPAGENVLLAMLARPRVPGLEGDKAFLERMMIEERVRICGALGKLSTATAKSALQKATTSPFEAVRKAATVALQAK